MTYSDCPIITTDLSEVKSANMRAAICQQEPVTWLANGLNGKTLPRELAESGYHIWFREELPLWLRATAA